mgnify:CR=1 FL=1
MYQIVEMVSRGQFKPFIDEATKTALTIEKGEIAKQMAIELSKTLGRKLVPRKVGDVNWRQREQKRIDSGEYQLPFFMNSGLHWSSASPRDHFLHVSPDSQNGRPQSDGTKFARVRRKTRGKSDRVFHTESICTRLSCGSGRLPRNRIGR